MIDTELIYCGLFENFDGRDSLVFAGGRPGIRRFAALLRQIANNATGRTHLNELSLFRSTQATDVTVEVQDGSLSWIRDIKRVGKTTTVVWTTSPSGATDSADALDALADHEGPAHQYLEKAGDIQIIVSVGEYDESLFKNA